MPIGALAGATVVAGVGSAAIGSSAQKKAAKQAAATQQSTTTQNNAMAREFYGYNSANLSPFMANGLRASNALNELLLGPQAAAPSPQPSAFSYSTQPYGRPIPANDGTGFDGLYASGYGGMPASYGPPTHGAPNALAPSAFGSPAPAPATPSALSAWDQFRNSTNYKFRFDEGMKALNYGYAGRGILDSGAAVKAALKYGQDYAANELGNYMGLLQGQQGMGLSGASALAGVGQNLVTNVSNNNQAAGSATANAQLASGNATAGMWGNIGSSVGNALGMVGTSYMQKQNPYGGYNPYGIYGGNLY